MTKKFLHTDKELNGSKAINEFLIPDVIDYKAQLIGIESGSKYDMGLVVYTGMDLTVDEVTNRIKSNLGTVEFDKETLRKIIGDYLIQIKGFKVGKVLGMKNPFILEER